MKHALNDELEQQKSFYHKCIVYKLTVCCKKSSYHVIIMQSGEYSHCWCSERIKVQQSGHRRGWLRVDWTCLGANYIQAATKIITPNQSRWTFDKETLEMMDRQELHIWQLRKWSTKDELFYKWQRKEIHQAEMQIKIVWKSPWMTMIMDTADEKALATRMSRGPHTNCQTIGLHTHRHTHTENRSCSSILQNLWSQWSQYEISNNYKWTWHKPPSLSGSKISHVDRFHVYSSEYCKIM